MKKVMETKKARERKTCDGLRRARLDCCTACWKLANRRGDRDESCCVGGVLRLSEKQQLEACRCSALEGTITPNADTALHFPQRPCPASDLAVGTAVAKPCRSGRSHWVALYLLRALTQVLLSRYRNGAACMSQGQMS